ncbi:hypothetical protein WJX73_001313 [Symbiochloris irregularis]|uniref:Carboxypeptidase n=1 Tax=Symbiochloris irregularis TaxID=706552 RepID=A0AAW1P279_9CHLO
MAARLLPTLLIATLSCGALAQYGPAASEIKTFPGFSGTLPSKQYGGYINIPGTEKELYYILVTSENDPATDPIVLWLNGGPGCSSLGGGYVEENGPFSYQPSPATGSLLYNNITLTTNPYSWSKVANMLYIDSPAGVGLSYSTNPADYTTDDYQTTQDAYQAILQWFEKYPYFLSHDFYITGESYAGVYVPLISSLVLDGIGRGVEPELNFKGYAIGNPSTDGSTNYDENGLYQGFHLISQNLLNALNEYECPNSIDNFNASNPDGNATAGLDAPLCASMADAVNNNVQDVFNYDLLKSCFYGQQTFNAFIFNQSVALLAKEGIDFEDTLDIYQPLDDYCDYDDRIAHKFLNDFSVRDAMHAAPFANKNETLAGFFEMCTTRVNYTVLVESTIPYHMHNIARGARVLVYSGDHDTVVPTPGTEHWTSRVGAGLGQVADWAPWYIANPDSFGIQVGGYLTQYNGLDFLTIRNAGHQVPTTQPKAALAFFSSWLTSSLNETTATPASFVMSELFPAPLTSGDAVAVSA